MNNEDVVDLDQKDEVKIEFERDDADIDNDYDELFEAKRRVREYLKNRSINCEDDLVDMEIVDNEDDWDEDYEEEIIVDEIKIKDKDHSKSKGEDENISDGNESEYFDSDDIWNFEDNSDNKEDVAFRKKSTNPKYGVSVPKCWKYSILFYSAS